MKNLFSASAIAFAIIVSHSHIAAEEATAATVATAATDESCVDHIKSGPIDLTLQGSSGKLSLTPLWEKQLKNEDGDQNNWSIALSNGYLYVCVDYYDDFDGRKDHLFLRRFNTSDGTETTITMSLPENTLNIKHSYPVIFNDNSQQLYMAYLVVDNTLKLRIYPIDIDASGYGKMIEVDLGKPKGIVSTKPLDEAISKMILDSVFDIHGSLSGSDYKFSIVYSLWVGTCNYYYGPITNGQAKSYSLDMKDIDKEYTNSVARPSMAYHPDNNDYFIVTAQKLTDNYYPVYMSDVDPVFIQMKPQNGNWNLTNCRGVHSFKHQGHPLFVMPVMNDQETGTQFALLSIPDYKTLETASLQARFPKKEFVIQGNMFRDVKQLAITESVAAPSSEIKSSRVTLSEPYTKLYVYAPGAGVGAYLLGEQAVETGIETVSSEETGIRQVGDAIYVSGSDAKVAELFRMDGKPAGRFPIIDNKIELTGTTCGMYLIRIGNTCKKVIL